MSLILHKGSSINSGHYIYIVKVGDVWFECGDVKITKIELHNFCNSNTAYMLFYKRSAWWKHLRGIGLVPMDATWFLLKIFFHWVLSFTFVTFLIHWPLSPVAFSVSWCWSSFVCSGLMKYSGGGPSTYIYCIVCYRVIATPCVRSVVVSLHTITLLM